jgi:hypothetical protein
MAKTFYKYAERSAESQINWAEVGKNVTEMLSTEATLREEKKAAIDEASRQFGDVLSNAPQGDFQSANEWTLNFANDAAQQRLIQDRLLKSGRMDLRDYTVQRQNLNDSTNQLFAVSKEYQTKYKEAVERYNGDKSQEFEIWLTKQAEGLSNFTNTKAYINPTNGQVSIAQMKRVKGADGKEVMVMDDNPDNYVTVNQLRNRMNVKLDKYQYQTAVDEQVASLGEVVITNVSKLKGAYRMLKIEEFTDPTKRDRLTDEEKQVVTTYMDWEKNMIESELSNPFNQLGLLTDAVNKVPGTNDFYDFTFDADLAKTNPKYIYMKDDGSGMPRPEFTEEQNKVAADFLRTQTRNTLDQKTKVDLQAEPSIQYAPNYGAGAKASAGSGEEQKKNITYYERANNALRTGNLSALNNSDFTFIFKEGENGGANRILVAANPSPGQSVSTEDEDSFKEIFNADDLAPYLTGIDPKKATELYRSGKKGFKDANGFELFATYNEGDNELDVFDPSLYTEEAYNIRRNRNQEKPKQSGGGVRTTKIKASGGGAAKSGGKPRG